LEIPKLQIAEQPFKLVWKEDRKQWSARKFGESHKEHNYK